MNDSAITRLLLCLVLLTPPTKLLAECFCNLSPADPTTVFVTCAWVAGDDLVADLVAVGLEGQEIDVELLVLGQSAPLQWTRVTFSSEGTARAVLEDAMLDADKREISYRLTAQDLSGRALMEPFAFAILFECADSKGCTYELLPSLDTEALIVTQGLDEALGAYPPCALATVLPEIEGKFPHLRGPAQTLLHQLQLRQVAEKSIKGCTYAWQTVVTEPSDGWCEDADSLWSGECNTAELGGIVNGAALCYSLQGTHAPAAAGQWAIDRAGSTAFETSILCVEGPVGCAGLCTGKVELALEYQGCVAAETEACGAGGNAMATADQSATLSVNESTVFESSGTAFAESGFPLTACDVADFSGEVSELFTAPIEVRLDSELHLEYSAGSIVSEWASAYAHAESSNDFRIVSRASSKCTETASVTTTIEPTDLLKFRFDGGLKLKRWRPPSGANARFKSGEAECDHPPICEDQEGCPSCTSMETPLRSPWGE